MIICYSMSIGQSQPSSFAIAQGGQSLALRGKLDRATSILEIQRSFRISCCRAGGYGGKIMSFCLFNGNFRILKWRYLPYIRPIFQAYVREYPQKIWPYMVIRANLLVQQEAIVKKAAVDDYA